MPLGLTKTPSAPGARIINRALGVCKVLMEWVVVSDVARLI